MYFYHAHAVALGGVIERPVPQNIGALASCALSISGGTSSAKHGAFDNGLVSFDSAQSDLTGGIENRNGRSLYLTGVSVAIYGLNMGRMISADQVVLRLACEHEVPPAGKAWGEPRIITTGCHFDNLKIAGYAVSVDMDHKIFSDYPTYGHFQAAWKGDKKRRVEGCLMGSTLDRPPGENDPYHLHEIYRGFDEQRKSADLKHTLLCSFVQEVNGIKSAEIDNWGPIIRIPQFGTIYLGEVIISSGSRRINMFRWEQDFDGSGGLVGGDAGVVGMGSGFPAPVSGTAYMPTSVKLPELLARDVPREAKPQRSLIEFDVPTVEQKARVSIARHFGTDEKWTRINRAIWSVIESSKNGGFGLKDLDAAAQAASSNGDDTLAVLALLSSPSIHILRMDFRLDADEGEQLMPSEVISKLRDWWKYRSLTDKEWRAWASRVRVNWIPVVERSPGQ